MRNAFFLPLPFDNPLAMAVVMRQPEPALFSGHYYCTSSFCIAKRAGVLFVLRVSVTWKVVFVLPGYPHFQAIGEVAWQQLHLQIFMYFHCWKVGSSNQIFECHYTCTWQQDKSESKDVGFIFSCSLDCAMWMGALHDGFSLSQLQLGFCCRTGCKQLFLQAGHPRSQQPEYHVLTWSSLLTAIAMTIQPYALPKLLCIWFLKVNFSSQVMEILVFSLQFCLVFPSVLHVCLNSFHQPSLYCRNATTIPLRPAQLTLFWVPWR